MITIKDIHDWAKDHPNNRFGGHNESKHCRFGNGKVEFSIVGGGSGLYGDFVNTFEVAIFDIDTKEFVTRFFYPDIDDDVIGWMPTEDMLNLINSVVKREDLSVEK